jgi:hypothetical protein
MNETRIDCGHIAMLDACLINTLTWAQGKRNYSNKLLCFALTQGVREGKTLENAALDFIAETEQRILDGDEFIWNE